MLPIFFQISWGNCDPGRFIYRVAGLHLLELSTVALLGERGPSILGGQLPRVEYKLFLSLRCLQVIYDT